MSLEDLTPGECRWMHRHDLHVYCRHPLRRVRQPDGREAWQRCEEDRRYMVVCGEAGEETGWLDHDGAVRTIDRFLAGGVPAAARRTRNAGTIGEGR
jgi:hypothetical protein